MGRTQAIGGAAEDRALNHLKKQGYRLLHRNWRGPGGEIDLIMLDKEVLVFVEVRRRADGRAGQGLESVHFKKQQRLVRTAELFRLKNPAHRNRPCRVDVVSVDGEDARLTVTQNALSL